MPVHQTPRRYISSSFSRNSSAAHAPPDGAVNATKVTKIIHIAKHCNYGNGNVHVAVDLACIQADAGCDVLFVSSGGTFEPMLAQHGVRHISFQQDLHKPLSMLCSVWRLAKLLRAFQPNVLHAHMMGSAVIGWVLSRITGAPLVTTVHNSFDPHSQLMRLGDRVVAVSRAEKDLLLQAGFRPTSVDVVLNAPADSPRDSFMVNAPDPILQKPCILTVCGLHHRKGVHDLLEACALLFQEVQEWRMYIAGEGPDRDALEAQVQSLGLIDRVTFLGFVPAPRTLLEQADIFVLCSYADPCSLVIGEARAAGCAIVASAVGGTPEMLDYGRKGRLVPAGKPAALAFEMRKLIHSPSDLIWLRRASLDGSEIFRVQRLLGDYDQVYQRARAQSLLSASTKVRESNG